MWPCQGELAADRVRASGGSVTYLQLDVTDEGGIDRVAEHVRCEHGALDLLVNNAGVCVRVRLCSMVGREEKERQQT